MTLLDLLLTCAPLINPVTLSAVIQQESVGNPLAVNDNTTGISYSPRNEAQAIALANGLRTSGHSLDLGLGQINSKNFSWLGLSVETVFNPCLNLNAAQTVLLSAWKQSGGQLPGTLSVYNTGKVNSEIGASYAASVYDKALRPAPVVPAIPGGKLPHWLSQEIPGTKKVDPGTLPPALPDTMQAPAAPMPAGPVRAIIRPPSVTPANSPLKPVTAKARPSDSITPANSPLSPITAQLNRD